LRFSKSSAGFVPAAAMLVALLMSGCGSTIHIQENVGGVDTLSVDAKQRMMLVGTRPPTRKGDYPIPVTCTEPAPDALVARAAALSANATINPPTGEAGGSGGLAGGSSESAASIGFRNQTVQMLRDGYYRLCEAYLNGAISHDRYESMIANADTFMAVVAALEVLGSQPVAPGVAISAGSTSANSKDGTAGVTQTGDGKGATIVFSQPVVGQKPDGANAKVVGDVVRAYLNYRERLNHQINAQERRRHG